MTWIRCTCVVLYCVSQGFVRDAGVRRAYTTRHGCFSDRLFVGNRSLCEDSVGFGVLGGSFELTTESTGSTEVSRRVH